MKKLFALILLVGTAAILQSCYKNYASLPPKFDEVQDMNLLTVGRVWEFAVDSTFYIEGTGDTRQSKLYIREEILDTTRDAVGNLIYNAVLSTKYDSLGAYTIAKNFYYRIEDNQIIRQMDNAPFIMIKAPIYRGVKWNAVQYTNADFINVAQLNAVGKTWNSEIVSDSFKFSTPVKINDSISSIANSIDVQLADITDGGTSDYTDRIYFYHIFAPGIGPVYRIEEAFVIRAGQKRGYRLEYRLFRYE